MVRSQTSHLKQGKRFYQNDCMWVKMGEKKRNAHCRMEGGAWDAPTPSDPRSLLAPPPAPHLPECSQGRYPPIQRRYLPLARVSTPIQGRQPPSKVGTPCQPGLAIPLLTDTLVKT